ncbi:MAG: 4'-phosphopantetheinyl transferase superfamily protein [Pseudomonadota bacterium]
MSDLLAELRNGRDVHLWLRRFDLGAPLSEADASSLGDDERERAVRFRREEDRCRYIRRHLHLREVLAAYLDCAPHHVPLDASLHVQPTLTEGDLAPDLRLSLSSSADRSLVAVAWRRQVGVDIEAITSEVEIDAVAKGVFSSDERAALMTMPADERRALFFRIWTRKEAFVKALGVGLSRDLMSFDVIAGDRRSVPEEPIEIIDREASHGDPIWRVQDVAGPDGFAVACCAEGEGWTITLK